MKINRIIKWLMGLSLIFSMGCAQIFFPVGKAGGNQQNTTENDNTIANDTSSPSVPSNFIAVAVSSSQINLSWLTSVDNVTIAANMTYLICISTVNGGCSIFTTSYTVNSGGLSYSITALSSSSTYYFVIRSKDQANNISYSSDQISATTQALGSVNAVTFSPISGTYNSSKNISLSSSTLGATICYTNNGSAPTCNTSAVCTSGDTYTNDIYIPVNITLKTLACKSGMFNSGETTATYVIDSVQPIITNVTSSIPDGTYYVDQVIPIQITFNKVVYVASGIPTLKLNTLSPSTTSINYTSGSGTDTLTFSYIVASGNGSDDLDYFSINALELNGATIKDSVGNDTILLLPAPAAAGSLGGNKNIGIQTQGIALWAKLPTIGTSETRFNKVSADSNGDIYAVGYQYGTESYFYGSGIFVAGSATSSNAVIVKYNSLGIVQWARSIVSGSPHSEFINVSVDGTGNIYAVGRIMGPNTYTFGSGVSISGSATTGFSNAVIVKYNSIGIAQWARSVNSGVGSTEFNGVTTDLNDDIYTVGNFTGTGGYSYGPAAWVTGVYNGSNAVVVKYNSSGTALWAKTAITGNNHSRFWEIVSDGNGDIYVAGTQSGSNNFNYGSGVIVTGAASSNNALIVKYNSSGTAQWARSVSSALMRSYLYGIAVDAVGNVYTAGMIEGQGSYTFDTGVSVSGTSSTVNALLVKYDSSGTAQWARSVTNSTSVSYFNDISTDNEGNIIAAGSHSTTYPVNFGNGVIVSGTSGTNITVVKFDNSGQAKWARSTFGSEPPAATDLFGITVDTTGNIFAVGIQSGVGMQNYGGGITVSGSTTYNNALIIKYNP